LIGCVFVLLPGQLMAAFIDNVSVIAMGSKFLVAMGIILVFAGFDFISVAAFQACGMGRLSFAFAFLRKVVLEIPLLFVLNHFFPLYGLPYAQLCAEVVLCIVAMFIMGRILNAPESEIIKANKNM